MNNCIFAIKICVLYVLLWSCDCDCGIWANP